MKHVFTLLLLLVFGCGSPAGPEKNERSSSADLQILDRAAEQWKYANYDGAESILKDLVSSTKDATIKQRAQARLDSVISSRAKFKAIVDSVDAAKQRPLDSVRTTLLPKFNVETDEFDGTSFYVPKGVPRGAENNIHLYIVRTKSNNLVLRMKIMYAADNWLFAKRVDLKAGDKVYSITTPTWERDNGSGRIWEWVDRPVKTGDLVALKAAMREPTTIRITGDKYYDDRKLRDKERAELESAFELYEALGGNISDLAD
jgi:hypothetical protein